MPKMRLSERADKAQYEHIIQKLAEERRGVKSSHL